VKRILCKFQFVNEDILRSQVMNQMKSFTNRDKNSDIKPFYQLPSAGGNLLNQSSMRLLPGVSGSPLKMYQSIDLEADDEPVISKQKRNEAINTLTNPSYFWTNNGIAYEVSTHGESGMLSAKRNGTALV
jgi:hypothetical protein